MAEVGLDQLVKGAPPPNVSLPSVAAAAAAHGHDHGRGPTPRASPAPSDPTALLPSSPPQIYLNLLILEASLRSQYLTLRARRRQHTFVLIVLSLWIAYFVYAQFLRPREDGGIGGSVYWLVDMAEKVALISGWVMGILFWVTGQWERGVRWPSRWLRTTNRGLRGMNCKIVVLKGPWWREGLSHLSFLFPLSSLVDTPGSNYQYIDYSHSERRNTASSRTRAAEKGGRGDLAEEDVAPGGDSIKILLLPKYFTPEFRENWEVYRNEYWEQENQRRAELRRRMREKEKALAKQEGLWFWRWRRGGSTVIRPPSRSSEKAHAHHAHNISHSSSIKDKHRRTASAIKEKEGSHSRSSSRSSVTFPPEGDERERRWSTSTSSSMGTERRRRKIMGAPEPARVKLTQASTTASRPATPTDILRPKSNNASSMGSGSEGDSPGKWRRDIRDNPYIKAEPAD